MKRETIEALIASYIYTKKGTVESAEEFGGEQQKFEESGDLRGKKSAKEFFPLSSDRHTEKVSSKERSLNSQQDSSSQISFETYAAREEYRRLIETEANYNFLKERLALAEALNVSLERAREYQEEFLRYESTKQQATKLLCNYLNPRRDIDCDEEINEIIDLLFQAMVSRVKCLNISPQLLEKETSQENDDSENWEEEDVSLSEA